MRLFVGNMPFKATEPQIRELFDEFGDVGEIVIPMDRETQRPKGYAFIDMPNDNHALTAIKYLDRKDFLGRLLNVKESRPAAHTDRGGFASGNSRVPV